ncbi:MAG: YeeE/YedE family protein [Chromatiaceae bacterium]|nr:YeeE/YedE family protein [Chromatiaceae bacterium]MCF8016706.1 YeeE/YedE family protein [Chromatiaceae bacterium]
MLDTLHQHRRLQLLLGLFMGLLFGILLQKGGLTHYDVVLGQLLFRDWTVVKIMLSAIIVGSLGIYLLKHFGHVRLQPKPASLGGSAIGGIIFGAGLATLGYCPGTVTGAMGQGSYDALTGGFFGILVGAGLFAHFYPTLDKHILSKGRIQAQTFPELWGISPWKLVLPMVLVMGLLLWLIERFGR